LIGRERTEDGRRSREGREEEERKELFEVSFANHVWSGISPPPTL
jgi:hypothetical protein